MLSIRELRLVWRNRRHVSCATSTRSSAVKDGVVDNTTNIWILRIKSDTAYLRGKVAQVKQPCVKSGVGSSCTPLVSLVVTRTKNACESCYTGRTRCPGGMPCQGCEEGRYYARVAEVQPKNEDHVAQGGRNVLEG